VPVKPYQRPSAGSGVPTGGAPGQVVEVQADGSLGYSTLPAGLNADANGPLTLRPGSDFKTGLRILADNGRYLAFADVAAGVGPNGQFTVDVYRDASAHVAKGVVMAIVSDADGLNPSAPITIASHATYDCRDISISPMSDGRLALSYFWENGGDGSHVMHGCVVRFITIATDGSLTVGPEINPTSDPFDAFVSCSGRVIDLGGNVLLLPAYGRMATQVAGQYSNVGVYKSTDAGATFPTYIEVANGGTTNKFQELNIVQCGDGSILATIRNNTTLTVWTSRPSDAGATWSAAVDTLGFRSQTRLYKRRASNRIYAIGRMSTGGSSGRAGIAWTDDHGATWKPSAATPAVPDKRAGTSDPYVYGGISEHADGILVATYGWELTATHCQIAKRFWIDDGLGVVGDPTTPSGTRTARLPDHRVKRVTNPAQIASGGSGDIAVTWPTPMPDTNYAVTVVIEHATPPGGTNGALLRYISAKTVNGMNVHVSASGVNVPAGEITLHCVAHRDSGS
jgi:hypothetical protein